MFLFPFFLNSGSTLQVQVGSTMFVISVKKSHRNQTTGYEQTLLMSRMLNGWILKYITASLTALK